MRLTTFGTVPRRVQKALREVRSMEELERLTTLAVQVSKLEAFEQALTACDLIFKNGGARGGCNPPNELGGYTDPHPACIRNKDAPQLIEGKTSPSPPPGSPRLQARGGRAVRSLV